MNVSVISMTGPGKILDRRTVVVCGRRIVVAGPAKTVKVPPGATRIEGAGKWLMPGLQDMHVHLEHLEDPDFLKLFLAYGVTTVRSMDGRPYVLEWRRAVEEGELPGPRIITAGPIIDGSPPLREDNLSIPDAETARVAVRRQAAAGYDFIKVYDRLERDAWSAIITEAKRQELPVAGHVPDEVPLADAIGAHWSIEHITSFGKAIAAPDGPELPWWAVELYMAAPVDPERMEALAVRLSASGVWVVPTLIERDRSAGREEAVRTWLSEEGIAELPEWIKTLWQEQNERTASRLDEGEWPLIGRGRAHRLALFRALRKAGVNIAAGTDTPNAFVAPGASLHRELEIYVEAGLSAGEALMTATAAPARMLDGAGAGGGRIEPGSEAELILLSSNPLAGLGALSELSGVYANGQWYDVEKLDAFKRSMDKPAASHSGGPN
ncbi:MAG: amidohydrolase family protein [Alphaproteobacteria bacterium]